MSGSTPEWMLKRKWGATLRDYDQGFESPGLGFPQALMAPIRHQKNWTCQIEEATAFRHSDRLVQGPVDCNSGCLEQSAKDSCLNHNINSSFSEHTSGAAGSCLDKPLVDLVGKSTSSGNMSYSFKKIGQLQFAYSLESARSASPADESEAMRKWKAIKQNGFLTHPHGGVPMPEPQYGKKSKRKTKGNDQKRRLETTKVELDNREKEMVKKEQDNKNVGIAKRVQNKRKIETAKREHDNMLKTAPSTGLLSRISTGIIRRVKNYEEVHAILEDMVRLKQPDGQIQAEFLGQEESGCKKIIYETSYQNQLFHSLNGSSCPSCSDRNVGKGTISENFDERSYPEFTATTSCIADYYKKLSGVLNTYSNIISRKCDSILSVEHDLIRSPIPPNSDCGRILHES